MASCGRRAAKDRPHPRCSHCFLYTFFTRRFGLPRSLRSACTQCHGHDRYSENPSHLSASPASRLPNVQALSPARAANIRSASPTSRPLPIILRIPFTTPRLQTSLTQHRWSPSLEAIWPPPRTQSEGVGGWGAHRQRHDGRAARGTHSGLRNADGAHGRPSWHGKGLPLLSKAHQRPLWNRSLNRAVRTQLSQRCS